MIVEEVNEDFVIANPTACNEWILKVCVGHRVPVNTKFIVDVKFVTLDLCWRPSHFLKCSKLKQTIVKVDQCKLGTMLVLLDFLGFDVLVLFAANLLFKC